MQSQSQIHKKNIQNPSSEEQQQQQLTERVEKQQKSVKISEHLQDTNQIAQYTKQSKQKLLKTGQVKWQQEFKCNIEVQIMETNFQWLRVMLRYGHFRMEILVIYTEIDQRLFEDGNQEYGGFGVVRLGRFQGQNYAVKGICFKYKDGDIDIEGVYKEYFLCCIAGILEVGPAILPLFGYDILLTKKMAFFCMQQCLPLKPQNQQTIKQQLGQNLKTLHSLSFIHNDIKPSNIAYSPRLKKYVYIDFGLSRLIQQSPGQRTITAFSGTLSYCSEEMKKCYFLKKAHYVDLYGNDWCSLGKVLRTAFCYVSPSNSSKMQEIGQRVSIERNIFQQVMRILKLKYSILSENIEQILHNISTIKNPRIPYEIFKNPQIPKTISENEKIQALLDRIRSKIFNPQLLIEPTHTTDTTNITDMTDITDIPDIADTTDTILCEFFCEEKRIMSADRIIPISQILGSEPQIFNQYLTRTELIVKLFHFIDPFSHSFCQVQNIYQLKRTIIQKIYAIKVPRLLNPIFFAEKVKFVLLYFYNSLRDLKIVKIMLALRLLLISLEQWRIVEALEQEIVDMIEQPLLKILKIFEFTLFRSTFLWHFRIINQKWIKWVREAQLNQNFGNFQQKVQSILSIAKSSKSSPNFPQILSQKKSILDQLDQISNLCCSPLQKQSIQIIKYFYLYLCKMNNSRFLQKAPRTLQMRIYSRSWSLEHTQLEIPEPEEEKLFWPLRLEYKYSFWQAPQDSQVTAAIGNYFIILKEQDEGIAEFLTLMLYLRFCRKEHLHFFLQKLRQFIFFTLKKDISQNGKEISYSKNNEQISQFDIEEKIACVNLCIEFILQNQIVQEKQKISKENKIKLINQLEDIFIQFVENQQIAGIINISQNLKLDTMITQLKFRIITQEPHLNQPEIKLQFENLVKLLEPLQDQSIEQIQNFFTLFNSLQKYLQQPQQHFSQDILMLITEQFICAQQFYMFQFVRRMPENYIRINNCRGKARESLDLLMKLIDYYRNKNQESFIAIIDVQVFSSLVDIFCFTTTKQNLALFYLQLKFSKKQVEFGFYAFLIFAIFLHARPLINESCQLKQIIRTTIYLKNMPALASRISRFQIVRLYKYLVEFKSKRKAFICRRLEIRNTLDSNKIIVFAKDLNNRIDKIIQTRKPAEIVSLKLLEKIKKYQKL